MRTFCPLFNFDFSGGHVAPPISLSYDFPDLVISPSRARSRPTAGSPVDESRSAAGAQSRRSKTKKRRKTAILDLKTGQNVRIDNAFATGPLAHLARGNVSMSIEEIFAPLERPFEVLSFVGPAGELWAPDRTGNYAEDCELGRFYARELMGFVRTRGCPAMLGHVCKAIASDSWSGVEVGFFHQISEAAADRISEPVN
jgi:hypothetical protein